MRKRVRVGTRNSPLALIQTKMVVEALVKLAPDYQFEWVLLETVGDRDKHTPLNQLGTQGIFTDELSSAILAEDIDFAVHSLKDMPLKKVEGLNRIYSKRENPFDSLILREAKTLDQLSEGAVIGTSSLRREVELLRLRPDLRPVPIRGNIDQRLEQLTQGEFDGIILANAGLNRLGWQNSQHFSIVDFDQSTFIPSVGQGTLALECRQSDVSTQILLNTIADQETTSCMAVECSFLEAMGEMTISQTCAAYAVMTDNKEIVLTVMFAEREEHPIYLRQIVSGHTQSLGKLAAQGIKRKW